EAPKPDANQSAPAPAEPSAQAAPTPGAVRVPEVVVRPPKLKRAAQAPRPRSIAAARPPVSANARNGFGIRNIVVLEDGFSVTQPDGLSRTDLIDPHAYGGVDVYRGPASAMFGNYATGGAINFRLWRGSEINGARYGAEGGSFGYLNNYAIVGGRNEKLEGAAFASDVRGNGYISHSWFNTQTADALGTYSPTPDNRFTLKAI